MKILAIETTGKYGSCALINEEGALYYAESPGGNDHLRELISTADKTLAEAGITKDELTHVAASVGPGSFTGIRIGVTAARTFSQFLGIPCIGVSSLEAIAERVSMDAKDKGASRIASIINARRHQTYAGVWSAGDAGRLTLECEERQYMIEELLNILKDKSGVTYFTGDGIDAYEEIIESALPEGSYIFAEEELRYQHAASVASLALAKAERGETLGYDELLPEYMRLAEAEQRLRAGTLSDKIKRSKL